MSIRARCSCGVMRSKSNVVADWSRPEAVIDAVRPQRRERVEAEFEPTPPPTESGCAGHGSQLWKNHELDFEHDALVVGLLIAAC